MLNRLFFKHITRMLILALSIFITTQAVIYEIKNFEAIEVYLTDETSHSPLIVLDIDNVIIRPINQNHGSDEWFCAQLEHHTTKLGQDFNQAVASVLPYYFQELAKAKMMLVEPCIKSFITNMLQSKIPVLALTARSHNLHELTIEQLKSVGINLTNNHDIIEAIGDAGDPIYYKDGVIFCGKNNKGKVLELCMKELSLNPATIIFVDDKEKNIKAVEGIGHDGREFIGFRYGFLDEHVAKFKELFKA